jgi:hypothetical protein
MPLGSSLIALTVVKVSSWLLIKAIFDYTMMANSGVIQKVVDLADTIGNIDGNDAYNEET